MAENKNSVQLSNPLKRSPYNKVNRPKENPIINKLREDGVIKNISLGAKYCLPTNKLNYEQISEIKALLGEESSDHAWKTLSMSESGWLAFNIDIKDADKIKPALDKYREYSGEVEDLFISGYGEISFEIDYSKLNMFMEPDTGNIYYPYGAFFFSDNKTLVNQFAASVACLPYKYQKIKNKRYISPITSDNWTSASITGSFTRRGHLVIFYVAEDIEKEPNKFHPVVSCIDIEVVAVKNYKTSEIEHVYIGQVSQTSKCVPDNIEYLVKNVYGKYAIPSHASAQFMSDYIFSIGSYSNNYDLTISERETTEENPQKFKTNFVGSDNAHHSADTIQSDSKDSKASTPKKNKGKGTKKKSKGNKTPDAETVVSEDTTKSDVSATEPEVQEAVESTAVETSEEKANESTESSIEVTSEE